MSAFRDAYYSADWDAVRDWLVEVRDRNARSQLFGRVVESGWDVVEVLIYYLRGDPVGTVDAAYDLAADAIEWTMTDVHRPYREMFQKTTASLRSGRNIERDAEMGEVSPYEGTETVRSYGQRAIDFVGELEAGLDTARAWRETFGAATDSGTSFSGAADEVLGQTRGYLVDLAVESTVGAMESAIRTKANCHAVSNCYANMTLPVVSKAMELEDQILNGLATPGVIATYHAYAFAAYQCSVLAYATSAKYWRQIADNTVWDVITGAERRAERHGELAASLKRQARYAQSVYGYGVGYSELNLERSVNVEEYGEPAVSLELPSAVRGPSGGAS